jgi:Family of unknown function (DUF6627)
MRVFTLPAKTLCWVLVVAILSQFIPNGPARAELVSTESVISTGPTAPTSERDRARLRALLAREDVQAQLRAYGVSADEAAARVDALTDREVSLVVKRLDEVAAGGNPVVAIVLVFVLLVYGALYVIGGLALLVGAVVYAATRNAGPVPAGIPLPEPPAPSADLKWPPINSSFVMSVQETGSYGSDARQQTIQFLGERPWREGTAFAFSDGEVTTYFDAQRRLLARVKDDDGALLESYAPYFVFADWPLSVGKSWPNRYDHDDRTRGQSFANGWYDGQVEAYEDVVTPAGTFRTFKIVLCDTSSNLVLWYNDDLAIVVKMRAERHSNHDLGSGVYEMELVSYDVTR